MKILETKRLLLRPLSETDLDFMRFYLADPERTRFLPLEKPYPEKAVVEWVTNRVAHWNQHAFGTYLLIRQASGDTIGFCGLEHVRQSAFVDIRYGLLQNAWGRGYAFEAASFCIRHGFECLGMETIYGAAVAENMASIHILEKLGMQPDPQFTCYGDVVEPYSVNRTSFQLASKASQSAGTRQDG